MIDEEPVEAQKPSKVVKKARKTPEKRKSKAVREPVKKDDANDTQNEVEQAPSVVEPEQPVDVDTPQEPKRRGKRKSVTKQTELQTLTIASTSPHEGSTSQSEEFNNATDHESSQQPNTPSNSKDSLHKKLQQSKEDIHDIGVEDLTRKHETEKAQWQSKLDELNEKLRINTSLLIVS